MKETVCAVCKKPAVHCCSNCNVVYYCCKEHQKQDWKNGHKANCAPYKIETNATLGRYLVATRKIKQGETIMRKAPLLIGPKMASYPVCLACHKTLKTGENFYRCSKCKWPLCDSKCEGAEEHKLECEIFSRSAHVPKVENEYVKQGSYCVILPFRALLLKKNNKSHYEAIKTMQSHLEEHKKTQAYAMLKLKLVPFIRELLQAKVDEDEILELCSIFDTNSFDVRDPQSLIHVRGIYPTISLMTHSCKHNTKHCFEDDLKILVTATENIEKGEILTTSYTQTLWGTLARRAHLKKAKHFDCTCDRCKDPTELGTYAGSILCSACRPEIGDEACPKMISSDPMDPKADWKCERCKHTLAAKQVTWGNEAIRNEILQMDKSHPKPLEEFLIKYENLLHPSNYHCLEIKYALSQMYGNIEGFKLTEVNDKCLERKINLCHELLEVADKLESGYSRFRGNLLYDLQAAMVVQTKREYEDDKITKEDAKETILEAAVILQESSKILSTEPGMAEILQKRIAALSEVLDFD